MIKAGLILAGIMLVLNGLIYVPLPGWVVCCLSGLGLAAGLSGGYQAGRFDRPGSASLAAKTGAAAGAIGGAGGVLAQVIGGLASSVALGPEGAVAILESVGWKATPAQNPFFFYGSTVSVTCCAGLFLAAVLAGLGALGGLLWYQTSGKKSAAAAM